MNQYTQVSGASSGNRPFLLGRALAARGHDVVVIGGTFDHLTREDRFPQRDWTYGLQPIRDLRVVWIAGTTYEANDSRRIRNMLTFTRRAMNLSRAESRIGRPDVVLGSSPHLLVPLAAERLASHYRVPFVMEIRDIWPESIIDLAGMSRRHPVVLALQGLERYLYARAARIVSLLPGGVEHLERCGVDPSRVTWIPNGVDVSLIPEPSVPPGGEPFTVMYAGSHGAANGVDTLLEAATLMEAQGNGSPVRWRFVGGGSQKPALMERAATAGLRTVSFEDAVPKKDVYGRLAEADAFVVNVRDEPIYRFGVSLNKFFDYMAMGRPTVVGLRSPYNPIDESGAGLTVDPDDPSAFADGVRTVMQMSIAERTAMGVRGRSFVETTHSIETLADELEQVLEGAIRDG